MTLCRSWSLDGGVFLPTILNWQSCSEEKKVDFTFSPLLFSLTLGGLLKPCSISELLGIYLMCGSHMLIFWACNEVVRGFLKDFALASKLFDFVLAKFRI